MNSKYTLTVFVLLSFLLIAGCDQPDWWPSPRPGDEGMSWPPPEPENWEGDWPPEIKDIEWWLRHYRESYPDSDDDPGNPDEPVRDGHAGLGSFTNAFTFIDNPQDSGGRPDCGLFQLHMDEFAAVEACAPFPGEIVRELCGNVRDPIMLQGQCAQRCESRSSCMQSHLYVPEMYIRWGCNVSSISYEPRATCAAVYLCECWER